MDQSRVHYEKSERKSDLMYIKWNFRIFGFVASIEVNEAVKPGIS
jgi:hypothetical protein